jgi:parallel beta-helix repeat protein
MKDIQSRALLVLGGLLVVLLLALFGPVLPIARSANLEVVSPADSGPGTLRRAIFDAAPGDTITFSPAIFPPASPVTIFVQSALPPLTQNGVTIDASNAGVILNGFQAPAGTDGLVVEADNCVIRGLRIQNFAKDGIWIGSGATGNTVGGDRGVGAGPNGQGNLVVWNGASGVAILGDNNRVRGNYIGVDPTGTWDWGNGTNGVSLWDGASGNIIGGTASGQRNVISGNDQNGLWLGGAGTDQNEVQGNYIGARADGLGQVFNGLSGVAIQNGARENRIGGTASGAGNLISGNADHGIYISDVGTSDNQVLGNIIGPNRLGTGVVGQGLHGVLITLGANNNQIGDGSVDGRNLISANSLDGVRFEGSDTSGNTVQGNYIGANMGGAAALPNGMHGVELADGAHDNLVGGNRLLGQGNLLSGNANHGVVITANAHHNTVAGNLIGPDATGSYSLGNHPNGGMDIANGAHDNVIGGAVLGEGNLISGNQTDGLALFKSEGNDAADNLVQGNDIGLTLDGSPMPNGGYGILNAEGATGTHIEANTIAFNEAYGILVAGCEGNTITQNSIYNNTLKGIEMVDDCLPPPEIEGVTIAATEIVTGTTAPNARVEFFSDDEDEGRVYEGYALADTGGTFSFSKAGGFAGPNLTATSTDPAGNTSEFSPPAHLVWTLLLYLNGDNDLEEFLFNTLTNTIAAGPSPRANVLVLMDGYTNTVTYSPTVVYDLTYGDADPLDVTWIVTGERNLGDGQTLVDFATWGQDYYPARHTLLALVDHGGGWAPSAALVPGALAPRRSRVWTAGNSGLSWDFSSDYDYLDSQEIRQAMADITGDGAKPLDVVFYDVCLMGMLEVAYQIQDYASFLVSSQNIGWAPLGPQSRYIQTIQGIQPTTDTPGQMAALLVEAYANAIPQEEHPFTIAALDLASLPAVSGAVDQLAVAISQTLTGPDQTGVLHAAYAGAQKLDYDSDLNVEPDTDGFVDLYDFALEASQQFSDPDVVDAAQALVTELDLAIVAEQHRSGVPWMITNTWDLDNVHGLSIFLPLGEDLELPISITETSPITPGLVITRNLRLRDMYTCEQLQFVCDTSWAGLINTYYELVPTPVLTGTTTGPVDGLLPPDITPPSTVINITGTPEIGQDIEIAWASSDHQAGVREASLWHHPSHGEWASVGPSQAGSSGLFSFTLSDICENQFAVRATDQAGNLEPLGSGANIVVIEVQPCYPQYFPVVKQASLR